MSDLTLVIPNHNLPYSRGVKDQGISTLELKGLPILFEGCHTFWTRPERKIVVCRLYILLLKLSGL